MTEPTLEDFLRRVERALLAAAGTGGATPDPADPEALSPGLALTGERPEDLLAERVGPDARVLVLAELCRLEHHRVGPPGGPLAPAGGHGALWGPLLARALAAGPLAVDAVAAWHPALAPRLARLPGGAVARRLAASDGGRARFESPPVPVEGAHGWAVVATAEPTLDGDWMVAVERRWTGPPPSPGAPSIAFVAAGLVAGAQELPPDRARWVGYAAAVTEGAVHAWLTGGTADPSTGAR